MRTLFVALLLGEERGRALARHVRECLGEKATERLRLPRPEGLHLTLFYLGPTEASVEARLSSELAPAAQASRAPELLLETGDAFPSRGRERVLWVTPSETETGRGRLADLHDRVLDGLERVSVDTKPERSRPFRPHVTVARPRRSKERLRVPSDFYERSAGIPWSPEELHLVESVRTEGPQLYRSVQAWGLRQA